MIKQTKPIQITHKQHYVQRQYLAHWENNNGVLFYKNLNFAKSNIQEKGASSVCRELDYYKLSKLTDFEQTIVNSLSEKSPESIRKHLLEFNSLPNSYFYVEGSDVVKQVLREHKEEIESLVFTQFGELSISEVEKVLDNKSWEAIMNCDLTFLDSSLNVLNLITYIVLQRTRVEKVREIIKCTINAAKRERPTFPSELMSEDRMFPYFVYNLTLIQSFFMAHSRHFHFIFLKSKKSANETFLTSDNPVIDVDLLNSTDFKTSKCNAEEQMSCFWPISPSVAIVMSNCLVKNGIRELSDDEIKKYNLLLKQGVKKYLIASSKAELLKYV